VKTTPKPNATKNKRGELLPPELDAAVVVELGIEEVDVAGARVDEGPREVVVSGCEGACWAARSTT
jgi:hypothetical protein